MPPLFIASLQTSDEISIGHSLFGGVFVKKPDAKAVIFSHGWPGCWIEFVPLMGMVMKRYTPETLP